MTISLTKSLALIAIIVWFFIATPRHGSASGDSKGPVTFNKDIAPIFYSNCVACHRPGDIAPMSLLSYKDARPWARSIREMVATRQMPPWHADPHYGSFSNDKRLSQREIDTVVAWVDQGAREGDPQDLPPVPGFVEGWAIGARAVVLARTYPYRILAGGAHKYVYSTMPTTFKEDKGFGAADIHPANKAVVHHVRAFIQPPAIAMLARLARGTSAGEGAAAS